MISSSRPITAETLHHLVRGGSLVGHANGHLDCATVIALARAYGDYLCPQEKGRFLIAHDIRHVSAGLAEAASQGLCSGNHTVVHVGMGPKPMLEWLIADRHASGGIYIGGDTLPLDWNGFYAYQADGIPLLPDQWLGHPVNADLNQLFARHAACDVVYHEDRDAYAARLRQILTPHHYVKFCMDADSGTCGPILKAILAHYRTIRLEQISFKPDGEFTQHIPHPYSEETQRLVSQCIRKNGDHFGFAFDEDGTALSVFDEQGCRIPSANLGVFLAECLKPDDPDSLVLHSPDTPGHLLKALNKLGIDTHPLSGDANEAAIAIRTARAYFYFDTAGHYVFSNHPGASNALLAMIYFINAITQTKKSVSARFSVFPLAKTDDS